MFRLQQILVLVLSLVCVIQNSTPVQGQEAAPKANRTPPGENPFPGRFPAPSLDGGKEWLNTSGPIELRELRGKIVLLDFWTYCCINCIHILPDLKYLEQKYPNELVVIGVHSAKFDNEKESENIRQAIMRYEIAHPVVNDAEMVIARKYQFSSWPTQVLIDPEGNFIGAQPGEGQRELFDKVIGQLAAFHRAKGTLDETPVRFRLERELEAATPLRYPGKLLADPAGNRLFISDSNHNRIVVATLSGELLDVIGTGGIGAADGGYQVATFDHPQGMALVGETLYVADTENHLLRAVDLQSKSVSTLAGTGSQGNFRGRGGKLLKTNLNSPWALQELQGVLYVAMAGPHQIWKHNLKSETIEPYAGSGREDILDGPRLDAALAQPSDIVTDGTFLYIVDSEGSAVRRIDRGSRGAVQTLVGAHDLERGASLFAFGDKDGIGDEVRLQHPIGLTWHEGSLYVADTYNDKIKRVNPQTRECVTWAGSSRGAGLDPVQFNEPSGLIIAGGRMLVADTNNHRIVEVDLETRKAREFVISGLQPPAPVTVTPTPPEVIPAQAVTAVTCRVGEALTLRIEFQLSEDYQLNELAPVFTTIGANPATLIRPDVLDQRQRHTAQGRSLSAEIPLTGSTGTTELQVTVQYQYCRHGKGGVCRPASQRWTIPLTVAESGSDEIVLTANPGNP